MGKAGHFGVGRNQLADCEAKLTWAKPQRNFVSVARDKVWARTLKDPEISSGINKKREKDGAYGREEPVWCSYTGSTSGLKYMSGLQATAPYTGTAVKIKGIRSSVRHREKLWCQKISSLEPINKYLKFSR